MKIAVVMQDFPFAGEREYRLFKAVDTETGDAIMAGLSTARHAADLARARGYVVLKKEEWDFLLTDPEGSVHHAGDRFRRSRTAVEPDRKIAA